MTTLDDNTEIDFRPTARTRIDNRRRPGGPPLGPLSELVGGTKTVTHENSVMRVELERPQGTAPPATLKLNDAELSRNAALIADQIKDVQRARDDALRDLAEAHAEVRRRIDAEQDLRASFKREYAEYRERHASELSDLRSQLETARLEGKQKQDVIDAERSERIRLANAVELAANSLRSALPMLAAEETA